MAKKYSTDLPAEPVALSDMRRDHWIMFTWKKLQQADGWEITYTCTGLRPIEQRKEAADQFDAVWKK